MATRLIPDLIARSLRSLSGGSAPHGALGCQQEDERARRVRAKARTRQSVLRTQETKRTCCTAGTSAVQPPPAVRCSGGTRKRAPLCLFRLVLVAAGAWRPSLRCRSSFRQRNPLVRRHLSISIPLLALHSTRRPDRSRRPNKVFASLSRNHDPLLSDTLLLRYPSSLLSLRSTSVLDSIVVVASISPAGYLEPVTPIVRDREGIQIITCRTFFVFVCHQRLQPLRTCDLPRPRSRHCALREQPQLYAGEQSSQSSVADLEL